MLHSNYLKRGHLPELDGIRGVSCLAVMTAHMHTTQWQWLSGGRGLIWFFLLSGYLITRLALREEAINGSLSLGAFYIRRAYRLFPLYYLVLAGYCVLILALGFGPEKYDQLLTALPWLLTYFQELPAVLHIGGGGESMPFGHSWSLGIEEKFYITWPLIAFVLLRGQSKRRRTFAIWSSVILFTCSLLPIGRASILVYSYANILAGCLLALLLDDQAIYGYIRKLGRPVWTLGLLLTFAVLHFAFQEPTDMTPETLNSSLRRVAYTLSTAAVFVSIVLGRGLLQRALTIKPLLFLGKISYGMYLVHRVCLNLVESLIGASFGNGEVYIELLLAVVLTTAVAYSLHIFVEMPCVAFARTQTGRATKATPAVVEAERPLAAVE